MSEITKKGQIKRKVSATDVEILHPETEADIVSTKAWACTAVASTDTSVVSGKTYYNRSATGGATPGYLVDASGYTYTAVVNPSGDPHALGYYEVSNTGRDADNVQHVLETMQSGGGGGGGTAGVSSIQIGSSTTKSGPVNFTLDEIGAQAKITDVANAGNVSTSSGVITLKNVSQTSGQIGVTSSGSATTYTKTQEDTLLGNKVDKKTTSGTSVYSHNGSTQGEINVVTSITSGSDIPTSGAVADFVSGGLALKVDKVTKVNGKSLSSDVTIYGSDISADSGTSTKLIDDTTHKIPEALLPDSVLGQMIFGGSVEKVGNDIIAYPSANLKAKLGISDDSIKLVNSQTDDTTTTPKQYGFKTLERVYFLVRNDFDVTVSSVTTHFGVGDWLIGAGTYWDKIDNTDAVTGVKGNAESTYRIGNVNITPANIGVSATTTSVTVGGTTFNKYSHPTGSGASKASGFYKFSTDSTSHISGTTAVTKADLTGLGVADDSLVVHKAGEETITGEKTFSSAINSTSGDILVGSGDNEIITQSTSGTYTVNFGQTIYNTNLSGTNLVLSGFTSTTIDNIAVPHGTTGKTFATTDLATSSTAGLVKSSTTGSTAGRDYNVQVNADGTMKVNVPWTDTNTTYSAGTGLSLNGTTFNHSNSVTAVTSNSFLKFKYDAQGHITGSTAVVKSDLTGLGVADDSNVVHKGTSTSSVAEDIYGLKSFLNDIRIGTYFNSNFIGTTYKKDGIEVGSALGAYTISNLSNNINLTTTTGSINITSNALNTVDSIKLDCGTSTTIDGAISIQGVKVPGNKRGKTFATTDQLTGGTVTSITAGAGLTGGTITTSGTIALATSGVTAGTYSVCVVDTYGRVTNGGQILDVVDSGVTPSVVNGGWYFECNAA